MCYLSVWSNEVTCSVLKNNITPVTLENDLTISCPSSAAPNPCFQQKSRCNHKQKADTALCLTDQIVGICCYLSQAPAHGGCAATLPHHSTAAIDSISPALLKGQGLFVPFSGLQRILAKHPAWLFWPSLSCLDPMLLAHVSLQDLELQKVHQAPSLENMIPG